MTKKATFTRADLARAISVADERGKVALWTPQGILFVESGSVALPSGDTEPATEGNSCDKAFGP